MKKDRDIVLSSPEWLVVLPKSLIKLEKKLYITLTNRDFVCGMMMLFFIGEIESIMVT